MYAADPLVKYSDAAGPKMLGEASERCARVAHVHQHEPAHDRIKRSFEPNRLCVAAEERHIAHRLRGPTRIGELDGSAVEINPQHGTIRSHHLTRQKGDVPNAAAD